MEHVDGPITVCFFGAYKAEYGRNRAVMSGLQSYGVRVIECSTTKKGIARFFDLIQKHWKIRNAYDILFVPFPGHYIVILARLLTRKKIFFDALVSVYDSLIQDRKVFSSRGVKARYYWGVDYLSLRCADVVVCDTRAHRDFFTAIFSVPEDKCVCVPVGSNPDIFYPTTTEITRETFSVHFHGTNIPLQGISYIIGAARILETAGVAFHLVGTSLTRQYGTHVPSNVECSESVLPEDLRQYMNSADVCLGIFGDTQKTMRVVPNKVYEAWACGRPVITADTPAMREILDIENLALLCAPANAQDLAEKILILKNNSALRGFLGTHAYQVFLERYTPKKICEPLIKVLHRVLH